jgi:hypothetical protein
MRIKDVSEIDVVAQYLKRVGAEIRSMRTAVVREAHGRYWKDIAVIRFKKDGDVDCKSIEHMPTEQEAANIKAGLANVRWPELRPIHELVNPPDMIKNAEQKDVFLFRNTENQIVMVQVRIEVGPESERRYVPWTYWDDDEWRPAEPDGPLPIYNAHRIKESTTVFIHEGGKAARHCQWMVDGATVDAREALNNHPWGRELVGAVHVGWVGGAMSPSRTDWSMLKREGIKRAYIVADNDEPGRSSVPPISKQIRIPTFMVQFTDEFPKSFDLADEFPDDMFGNLDGGSFYIGPSFRDCMHPATWATDLVPPANGKGRPSAVLRDSFKSMWTYIEEADLFVCRQMPEILRSEAILNKMLAPFSHVKTTTDLIVKAYQGRSTRVCYRPDQDGLLVTSRGSSAINLHVKPSIYPRDGDPTPFIEFMEYMFIRPEECEKALRWCATLIARPDIRMGYGMLLISEKQGVGKTTLGSAILAPLVGDQNVGWPSENDINSQFNDWVANRRLAIVSEIYSGSSWRAYNTLKAVITDKDINVNQKYMRPYKIENWVHIFASSNSMRALKMENDDRRWFYPEITEVPWPKHKFENLRKWIDSGGLSIILQWALEFGDYVHESERAPMTARKIEMIEGSRSEAQTEAAAIAEVMKTSDEPVAVLMKDVVSWCRQQSQGKVFDSDYEIRKAMTDSGVFAWGERIKVGGRLQYVIINNALKDLAQRSDDEKPLIRSSVKKCNELMEEEM